MDINLLPVPQSRAELFLDCIARNSNDLSRLPIPYSRIELFLDYIARNMNAGGNGSLTQEQVQSMINGLIKNATFDESTKTLSFEKEDGTLIDIDLSSLPDISLEDLASKTSDNIFVGTNSFDDLYITSKDAYIHGGDLTYRNPAGGTKRVGRRDYTSHSNNNGGFVKSLIVHVSNTLTVGSITNVKVWKVRKGTTHVDDEPNLLIENIEVEVKSSTQWTRYVEIPIYKYFEDETYFIFEVMPSSHLAYADVTAGNDNIIYIVESNGNPQDVTAENINNSKGARYSCICALTGGVNIKDFITNAGTVKTVNNQTHDGQGNVTLNANHFNDIYSKTESDAKYYACTTAQIDNANDFKEFGIARTKSSTTNLPNVNRKWGVIQFFKENNNYGIQLYYPTDGDFKGTIWTRNIHNNTWSSWKRLATNEDISGTVKSVNGQTPNAQGSVTIRIDNITNLQDELDKKVEAWTDLKYAESIDGGNLFNKNKLVRGRYVAFANGTINTNSNWGVYWSDFYVKSGDTFIINKTDPTYAYYVWYVDKNGGRFERSNITNYRFTVPNDERIVGFVLNVSISGGSEDDFMLYRGHTLPPSYEPYTGDYVLFSHKGFKFGFDNGGKTDLGDDLQTAVSALATRVMSSVVGELKTLAYDAGEQFEEGGRIWLRCDGQSLPVQYDEFYRHMRNVSEENMPEFTLPHKPDYGYLYICAE